MSASLINVSSFSPKMPFDLSYSAIVFAAFFVLVFISVSMVYGYQTFFSDTIYPGVTYLGVDLSGPGLFESLCCSSVGLYFWHNLLPSKTKFPLPSVSSRNNWRERISLVR